MINIDRAVAGFSTALILIGFVAGTYLERMWYSDVQVADAVQVEKVACATAATTREQNLQRVFVAAKAFEAQRDSVRLVLAYYENQIGVRPPQAPVQAP